MHLADGSVFPVGRWQCCAVTVCSVFCMQHYRIASAPHAVDTLQDLLKVLSVATEDFDFSARSISQSRLLTLLQLNSREEVKGLIKWTRWVLASLHCKDATLHLARCHVFAGARRH